MKRELDLIRDILLEIEAMPAGELVIDRAFEGHSQDEVAEHVHLLIEADFVEGRISTYGDGSLGSWHVIRLTMEGHDFLDSIRSPEVFTKTKKQLAKVGGTAALEVVKAVAQQVMTGMVGLG